MTKPVIGLMPGDARVQPAWRSCPSVAAIAWSRDGIAPVDLGKVDPAQLARREVSPASGRPAGETLHSMTQLALQARVGRGEREAEPRQGTA